MSLPKFILQAKDKYWNLSCPRKLLFSRLLLVGAHQICADVVLAVEPSRFGLNFG